MSMEVRMPGILATAEEAGKGHIGGRHHNGRSTRQDVHCLGVQRWASAVKFRDGR
jgi:hypothetical protein